MRNLKQVVLVAMHVDNERQSVISVWISVHYQAGRYGAWRTFLVGFSQACHPSVQIIEEGVWWCFGSGHCSLLVLCWSLYGRKTPLKRSQGDSLYTVKDEGSRSCLQRAVWDSCVSQRAGVLRDPNPNSSERTENELPQGETLAISTPL